MTIATGTPTAFAVPIAGNAGTLAAGWIGAGSFTDGTFVVQNAVDATKQFNLALGGMTTGKTLTLSSGQTTTQTLQIPNIAATDTLATLGLAQTFSAIQTFSAAPVFSAGLGAMSGTTLSLSGQLTSTLATGTAPFSITSTTLVPNLYVARSALSDTVTTNANLTGPITSLGNATSVAAQTGTGSTFVMQASPTLTTPNIGAATGTSLSVTGQLTSTLAIGTAPLVVTSTTNVANLNASSLNGATFAAPGAIGGGTASSGAFTALSGTSGTFSSLAAKNIVYAGTSGLLTGDATFSYQNTITTNSQGLTLTPTGAYAGSAGQLVDGMYCKLTYNPGSANSAYYVAAEFVTVSSVAAQGGALISVWGEPRLVVGATGTYSVLASLYAPVTNQSTATITSAYGLWVPTPSNSGGGTIATMVAIQVDAQTLATTNYAFRSSGAGLVSIGDTTASTSAAVGALVVSGGMGLGGALNAGGNVISTLARVGSQGALTTFASSAICSLYRSGGVLTPTAGDMILQSDPSVNGGIYLANGSTPVITAQFVGGTLATAVASILGTTSASSSTTGAFVVGNGTAATSVAIGGGNLQVGGNAVVTGTFGAGGSTLSSLTLSSTNSTYSGSTGTVLFRANSGSFNANSIVMQSGGTTTAGGGFYFGVNNGVSTSTIALIGTANPAANTFGGSQIFGRNNAAADIAGVIGETITSAVTAAAAGGTTTTANITSISLTAGKWRISGLGIWTGGATGLTSGSTVSMSITSTTAGTGTAGSTLTQESVLALLANGLFQLVLPEVIVNISATTTYFLTGVCAYVAGSPTIAGNITAVRI